MDTLSNYSFQETTSTFKQPIIRTMHELGLNTVFSLPFLTLMTEREQLYNSKVLQQIAQCGLLWP